MLWDLLDPAVMKHLAWAIILCIGAIILFSLAFAILQARQRRRLCWAAKHNYVPDWTKGAYNGVSTLDEPDADPSPTGLAVGETGGVPREQDLTNAALFKANPTPTPIPPFVGDYRLNGYSKGAGYPSADPKV